jgi:hypothetical protein
MSVEHRIAFEDDEWPEGAENPLDNEDELEEIPMEENNED